MTKMDKWLPKLNPKSLDIPLVVGCSVGGKKKTKNNNCYFRPPLD